MVYNSMSITDNLPDGLTLVDASISENASGSLATDSGSASYQFDESWLADESHYDGREYTLTIQARVNEGESGDITNTAQSAITTRGGKGSKAEDSATIHEKLFKVTHEFVSGTPGKELPEELKNRTPSDQTDKKDGEEVTPGSFDETEYKVDGGTWKFKSWDADSKTIDKADEHFTGTWVFEEDTYKVTHEFVSGTEGKELPEELKNRTPSDQTDKKDGEEVTPGSFDETEYKVDGGTWKFKSWDADSKTIDKADEHFTGTWVFVEDPKEETYKVTHEFVSGTPGKELPEELKNRTPSDQTGKKDGEEVTPGSFDKTEYKVEGGTWKFKSWDADSKTIDGADVHFVGTWIFIPDTEVVKTGDSSNRTLWSMMMLISAAVIFISLRRKRKI
ncbi:MAG: SHIRT domain-containing protein, partial [Lachnospiraceae bacterium]|nr:SHIRT domain-containing protein [Lachnospiraceae bacterium]